MIEKWEKSRLDTYETTLLYCPVVNVSTRHKPSPFYCLSLLFCYILYYCIFVCCNVANSRSDEMSLVAHTNHQEEGADCVSLVW